MAKLTNLSERIEELIVVRSNEDTKLTELGTGAPCDDFFVIMYIAVPVQEYQADEMLLVRVNGAVVFSWPLAPLISGYRRFTEMAPPEAMSDLHECVRVMTAQLAQRWRDGEASNELVASTDSLCRIMHTFSEASARYLAGAGVTLLRNIPVPPRAILHAEGTQGSALKVYLRGLRSRGAR
ncbi:MAG: hypothetical protein ACTSX8_04555 [Alphaproteobacteria bacterium]